MAAQSTRQKHICPKCTWQQEISFPEVVNVTQDPKLKERVLKRELGQFTCENCSSVFYVPHAILYHDVTRKLMIWLPFGEDQTPALTDGSPVMSLMAKTGYKFRWVNSYNELIEKIRIFDDGHDDRALELLKLSFRNRQSEPLSKLLFYNGVAEKSPGEKVVHLVEVKKTDKISHEISQAELKQQTDALSADTKPETATGKWLHIDQNYADAVLKAGAS